jgi:nitrate reductase NapAB chaperone NapD
MAVQVSLPAPVTGDTNMTKLEAWLLLKESPTFSAYYNGKMSYSLHGEKWKEYVASAFPDMAKQQTSENIFKTVIDLYAENLVPVPEELRGFSNCLVPLLSRGECVVVVDSASTPHFPEHYEMVSDGRFTIAAIYTRSLEHMEDYVTFAYSDGKTRMFKKAVPDDLTAATKEGYTFGEELTGNTLYRFALDDKGFGATLAALQDRVNHSIIDQTIVAEMYARPFWYLLNVELPPQNPYLPASSQTGPEAMKEQKGDGATGRIFTTSSEGPFGQLDPPTISDMIAYHDSIINKVPLTTGVAPHVLKPGEGVPPTGVALKVLSKRFNNKIARMREDIEPTMKELAALLGVEKTVEIEPAKKPKSKIKTLVNKVVGSPDVQPDTTPQMDYELWNTGDDLLQESLDAHGLSLSQMGYPLNYIASVVTPGVDLAEYETDTLDQPLTPDLGTATDMTAMGQTGLVATPGQVAAYGQNPGQRAKPKGQ